MKRFAAIIVSATIFTPAAQAADFANLESGNPTELTDAAPIAYQTWELQSTFRYDRLDGNEDRFTLAPRFETGIAEHTQFSLEVPILMGEADQKGSGDIIPEVFYNFHREHDNLPAAALAASVRIPTGEDSDVTETQLKLILSKEVMPGRQDGSVHANIAWGHLFDEDGDERDDRLSVAAGYSQRATNNTLVVVDYVFEQQREEGREFNLLEGGARYSLDKRTVLTGAIAAGLSNDSPDVRATTGVQYTF